MVQRQLKLTADQKSQVAALQKEVDARLEKILTAMQRKQLEQQRSRPQSGGPPQGGPPDGAPPDGMPPEGGPPDGGPPEGGPPPGGPGGPPGEGGPGGFGGPRSTPYTLSGTYTLSGGSERSENQQYTAATRDVSAVYVKDGGQLTLISPTVTTTGNSSSSDNSSFHGLNAGILATQRSKVTITGGSVSTSGTGANGVFAAGTGAEAVLTGVKIKATGSGGHGVMATKGGKMTLKDCDLFTASERAGAVATDRGGGTIVVEGGVVRTAGTTSPTIYSTGDIRVTGARLEATGSEAAVIEGSNSITLTDCTISGRVKCSVMIYQSFSGDAEGRRGTFTMKGGALTAAVGPLFYVTNTTAVIRLSGARLEAASGKLLDASAGRWGRSGSNGGTAILTADAETLTGDMTCDDLSSISATLRNGTTLTGAVHGVALTLDATSTWNVTADSVVTSLTDPGALAGGTLTNIHGHGHTVRYDPGLPANGWLSGKTYSLAGGGRLVPDR